MQYHLGGIVESYMSFSPLKSLIDEARKIANNRKCIYFHLGGGLGGRDDNLFVFKSRMTTLRHTFKVWQWIIDENTYQLLSRNKIKSDFFPSYRISNE
jgi:thiamine pyrophosphokinase